MPDAMLLVAAVVSACCGMAWLALAMDTHWKQVRSDMASQRAIVALRMLGTSGLIGSLLLCLRADHASMAVLVWVMALAAAALLTALVLSWRPRMMLPLVAWLR